MTGADIGEPVASLHVARLLASPKGSLQATAGHKVIPVINIVDDEARGQPAKDAEEALAMTARFDRMVLTATKRDQPLVAVVTR
ncbi:MAG: hypothetical protein ACT4NU_02550 [Chromatiales bacterium]